MPCDAFTKLFQDWPDNEELSLKMLRLKAITLLALACMTRPCDLAPHGVFFDKDTLQVQPLQFTTDQITFNADGSMSLKFFGIKNDSDRSGFEIKIPKALNCKADPVACLRCYIDRTAKQRPSSKPVFISLVAPFKGIVSGTIASILNEAISLAGLAGQGYSAKSFRPTGATAAIAANCLPETAMQIGRWKTKEVFFNRYVYPNAPEEYTDGVLDYKGLLGQ